jgi:hypothetical protein
MPGRAPASRPVRCSSARTVGPSSDRFLGANGWIEGATTRVRCPSTQSGTCRWVENTSASAPRSQGRRKRQARVVCSLGPSLPTWQRHTTTAPMRLACSTRPTVWKSCRNTTSPGRTSLASSAALASLARR